MSSNNNHNSHASFRRMEENGRQSSENSFFRDEYPRHNQRRNHHQRKDLVVNDLERAPYANEDGSVEDGEEEEEIYIVRQDYGYLSILFSFVQIIIMGLMMWQCGIAPMNVNPMIGPYPDALSEWGGKNTFLILNEEEWYRLMTPILLHAGIIHLFCNVAVQLETGVFFEREWGSLRWLIIYLASALGSSILSVIVMPNAVSVGSSGAVMGLFGGKLAEVVMRMFEKTDTTQSRVGYQVRKEQCVAVTCSVTLVMAFSFIPYVDWAAHLGGLIAGFVVGIGIFAWDMHLIGWQLFWFAIGAGSVFFAFSTALAYMYSGNIEASAELEDVCGYYQKQFEDYECRCMREEFLNNLNGNNNDNNHD
jgi:membrane associated rhomboid family serine protease